jgi:hypothetical protein
MNLGEVGWYDRLMDDIETLHGLVLALQAEISALKQMMFRADPNLALEHQRLTDKIRADLLRGRADQKKRG